MLELTLPGMTCGGCARGVTAAIKSVDPAAEVVTVRRYCTGSWPDTVAGIGISRT